MRKEQITILKESIEMELELRDFIDECLKEIFGDKYMRAKHAFEEDIEFVNCNGCLQGLERLKKQVYPESASLSESVTSE